MIIINNAAPAFGTSVLLPVGLAGLWELLGPVFGLSVSLSEAWAGLGILYLIISLSSAFQSRLSSELYFVNDTHLRLGSGVTNP